MNYSLLLAAVLAVVIPTGSAVAQDVNAGAAVFKKCAACHAADAETNKIGPHLVGVLGREAANVEGFRYSQAMLDAAASGLVWDEANLSEYLAAPKLKVPGTKMVFVGLKKPGDVQNLLAYLKSLQVGP